MQLPEILMQTSALIALLKPPGWEIDDEVKPVAGFPLSKFLQRTFAAAPVVHDAQHSYGIIHRLDVPSSGLLLVGVTYAGYYELKWQLDTALMIREYLVSGYGVMRQSLVVQQPVYHGLSTSNRRIVPSVICEAGKPSESLLRCVAAAQYSPSSCKVSMVTVRINTGRRHQIRAHFRHVGHPTVTDGKYNPAKVWTAQSRRACAGHSLPPRLTAYWQPFESRSMESHVLFPEPKS